VYPLFNIFRFSFLDRTTGVPSLSNYREFFTTPYYYRAFVNSMVVAIGGTTGALLLGIPLAFLTTRFKIFGSSFLSTFAVLALLSPPFIGAYAWITMLGRNGFLRNILSAIGITVPTIYGPGASSSSSRSSTIRSSTC
jgi:iron(III) transport system permease protein